MADPVGAGAPGSEPPRPFRPAWWLPSPHGQTLWPALARRAPRIRLRRERVELADGDFLELDWAEPSPGAPLLLLLHGLEGSSRSGYARGLIHAANRRGWSAAVMHFRGCGGAANRHPRTYHSGETSDLDRVLGLLRHRDEHAGVAVVGYSLGGNVLLKWLGERGATAPVRAAVAVSVPFVLADAARRLERGASRLYQAWLLRSMRASIRRKQRARPGWPPAPARLDDALTARTMWAFDDAMTAPLHGFAGADDYYGRSSARRHLAGIGVPTLVLHAADDPFMTPAAVPTPAELPPQVRLELQASGGHVGFVEGGAPWRARYWLETRIPEFLATYLEGRPSVPRRGASGPT